MKGFNQATDLGSTFGPTGIAVDKAGSVYVADTYNHRIQKFDSNGKFITKWGSAGSGDGQFMSPYGIDVDDQWGSAGSGDGQFKREQKKLPNQNRVRCARECLAAKIG